MAAGDSFLWFWWSSFFRRALEPRFDVQIMENASKVLARLLTLGLINAGRQFGMSEELRGSVELFADVSKNEFA